MSGLLTTVLVTDENLTDFFELDIFWLLLQLMFIFR